MKKSILLLAVLIGLTSCNPFFMPSFQENMIDKQLPYDTAEENPFAEIGSVKRIEAIDDSNNVILRGVMLSAMLSDFDPNDSNSIYIFFDFSESALKPSEYTQHVPFLICGNELNYYYRVHNGYSNFMDPWNGFIPDNTNNVSNQLVQSPYHPDVYYIRVTPIPGYPGDTAPGGADVIEFKPGNFLNTPEGVTALKTGNWWNTIGYQDFGYDHYILTISNIGGIHEIYSQVIGKPDYSVAIPIDGGYFMTPDRRAIGFKVNGYLGDWSMQTAGMSAIPAGTRLRLIWENLPSDDLLPIDVAVTNFSDRVWIDWPSDVGVFGNQVYLSLSYVAWDAGNAHPVTVDLTNDKAVVTITFGQDYSPGLSYKITRITTNYTHVAESQTHSVILPQPKDGAITIIADAVFDLTNKSDLTN